eukprot:gene5674-6370_t
MRVGYMVRRIAHGDNAKQKPDISFDGEEYVSREAYQNPLKEAYLAKHAGALQSIHDSRNEVYKNAEAYKNVAQELKQALEAYRHAQLRKNAVEGNMNGKLYKDAAANKVHTTTSPYMILKLPKQVLEAYSSVMHIDDAAKAYKKNPLVYRDATEAYKNTGEEDNKAMQQYKEEQNEEYTNAMQAYKQALQEYRNVKQYAENANRYNENTMLERNGKFDEDDEDHRDHSNAETYDKVLAPSGQVQLENMKLNPRFYYSQLGGMKQSSKPSSYEQVQLEERPPSTQFRHAHHSTNVYRDGKDVFTDLDFKDSDNEGLEDEASQNADQLQFVEEKGAEDADANASYDEK